MIHLLYAADAHKGIFTHFPKKIDLVVALLFSSALSIFLFPSCGMCVSLILKIYHQLSS